MTDTTAVPARPGPTEAAISAGSAPESTGLRGFRRLALVTTGATYLLIFVGGLVRVAGAGLGCPDWPKCFGRWIPPTDISQVPPEIDSSLFNVTLAWIEYVNRLIGVVIGFLILATAVWAIRRYRHIPSLVWPAVLATVLVAFQGWLGSVVVTSLLEPWIVTLHLVVALLIVSLLVYTSLDAYYREHPQEGREAVYPARTRTLLIVLWVLALVQITMGTQIRGALEHLIEQFPLLSDRDLLSRVGNLGHVHLILGLAVAALTWVAGMRLLRRSEAPSRIVVRAAQVVMGLVVIQLLIGFGFVRLGIPPLVQLFHSWTASLFIGALLVLYTACTRRVAA